MKRFNLILLASFSCLILSSCSTKIYHTTAQQAQTTLKKATQFNQQATNQALKENTANIQIMQGNYIGSSSYLSHNNLPLKFTVNDLTLFSPHPLSLPAIANLLSSATGISVSLDPSLLNNSNSDTPTTSITQTLLKLSDRSLMKVNFHGKLIDFIEQVSSFFNVVWSYDANQITFSKTKVETFPIMALPSKMQTSSNMSIGLSGSGGGSSSGGSGGGSSSGDSGGGSSGGGASQKASMQSNVNFWSDLGKALTTILGKNGTFNISESTSSVTVDANPIGLKAASAYINELNTELSKQVTVNVSVYSIELNNNSNWDFSLNAAFNIKNDIINIKNNFSNATFPSISGQFKNVKLLFDALDKIGKISEVTNASVTTMSGQAVPFQVATQRGYVSAISETTDEITGDKTDSMQTAIVNAGFSLVVLPKILRSGEVLLQYGVNISSLVGKDDGFVDFTMGKNQVQLPDIAQRSFIQESMINNGNTLVLAGYEDNQDKTGNQGVGNPNFKLLGGNQSAQENKQIVVILITPVVLDLHRLNKDASK